MTRRWTMSCSGPRRVLLVLLTASLGACGSPRTLTVTSGADDGPGSFRESVRAANAEPAIGSIVFAPGLRVALESPVVYTGTQNIVVDGRGAEIVGAPAANPAATWDAGLFTSRSAGNVTLQDLVLRDSFNNGVGVFIPADAEGVVVVSLKRVTIEGSRFHGLLVDGQLDDKFNTDGVPHPLCEDPWGVDSAAGIELQVSESKIADNGRLTGGFDTGSATVVEGRSVLSGCPADFDGIRVDDGGPGGITALIESSRIEGNLADGVEYDERGPGDVRSRVLQSTIAQNGDTGTDDLDDGFDIDEAGAGSLEAFFEASQVVDNRDEGIDLDEAGAGDASLTAIGVTASRNEDQGIKVDERGAGDLSLTLEDCRVTDSHSQKGIQLEEEEAGSLQGRISKTVVSGNAGAALSAKQKAPGSGMLTATRSDLTGNEKPSLKLKNVEVELTETRIDEGAATR